MSGPTSSLIWIRNVLVLTVAVPLTAQVEASAVIQYTVERIAPYSGKLIPRALNNRGWVVGTRRDEITLARKPFRYRPGVGFEEITGSFDQGELFDINDAGTAVGYVRRAGELNQAVIRPAGSPLKRIGPEGTYSIAFAINEAGQVVGTVRNASGQDRPFIYTEAEGMKILFDQRADAIGINEAGQVTGPLAPGSRAFLWDPVDGLIDINSWLGLDSEFRGPVGIGDNSTVAGLYRSSRGTELATFSLANGLRRIGGNLFGLIPTAVNDRGWVVGQYIPAPCGCDEEEYTAFLYVYGQGIRDLNTLLVTPLAGPLAVANDINDHDDIVAAGGGGWNILRRVR